MVHNQLQAKDDCWRIDALYKLQPNKVHSKKMQYMKVHHGEVHHKEVHHEEVQLKLQRHKSDRWEKTTVGILRHCTRWLGFNRRQRMGQAKRPQTTSSTDEHSYG